MTLLALLINLMHPCWIKVFIYFRKYLIWEIWTAGFIHSFDFLSLQIVKLNRRLQLLEEENKERVKREMIMYSLTVAFWLINSWVLFRRWSYVDSALWEGQNQNSAPLFYVSNFSRIF